MNLRKLASSTLGVAMAAGMVFTATASAADCDEGVYTGTETESVDEDGNVTNECMEDPAEGDEATADTTAVDVDGKPGDAYVYTEQPSEDGSGGHVSVQLGEEDEEADGSFTGIGKATIGGSPEDPVIYIEDYTDGDQIAGGVEVVDDNTGCNVSGDEACQDNDSDSDAATVRPANFGG